MACEPITPEVDLELRRLVDLLNLIDGVETKTSCAGHEAANPTVEVGFAVEDLDALRRVLQAMPFLGGRGRLIHGPVVEAIHITAVLEGEQVLFRMLISAAPPAAKLDLVRQVERAMAEILGAPARRFPCSRPE